MNSQARLSTPVTGTSARSVTRTLDGSSQDMIWSEGTPEAWRPTVILRCVAEVFHQSLLLATVGY